MPPPLTQDQIRRQAVRATNIEAEYFSSFLMASIPLSQRSTKQPKRPRNKQNQEGKLPPHQSKTQLFYTNHSRLELLNDS